MSLKSKLSTVLYLFSNKGLYTTKWSFSDRGGYKEKIVQYFPMWNLAVSHI